MSSVFSGEIFASLKLLPSIALQVKEQDDFIPMAISLRRARLDLLYGTRGRPRAPWHSPSSMISLDYLVRISKKYELDSSTLLDCIQCAWTQGESSFDSVSVKRRQTMGNDGVFLITQNDQIMTQLKLTPVQLEQLRESGLHDLLSEDYAMDMRARPEPEDLMIKDLTPRTKRFNLQAKVTEKSTPRIILSQWGKELLLSTVTIKDRSGTIKLPLWNDQIEMVSVGDILRIENAQLKKFHGELNLRVGKSTMLRVVEKEDGPNGPRSA
jgi:replication factor A1